MLACHTNQIRAVLDARRMCAACRHPFTRHAVCATGVRYATPREHLSRDASGATLLGKRHPLLLNDPFRPSEPSPFCPAAPCENRLAQGRRLGCSGHPTPPWTWRRVARAVAEMGYAKCSEDRAHRHRSLPNRNAVSINNEGVRPAPAWASGAASEQEAPLRSRRDSALACPPLPRPSGPRFIRWPRWS